MNYWTEILIQIACVWLTINSFRIVEQLKKLTNGDNNDK